MDSSSTQNAPHRLSRQILSKVLLFGMVIVSIATIICYYQVFNQSKNNRLTYLRQYMEERSQQENQIFNAARKHLDFFREEFLNIYLSDISFTEEDFGKLYFVDKDGATRMKRSFFDEKFDTVFGRQWGLSSFIGNNQRVDSEDFQRRILISYILVNRYGPAWRSEGVLHVTFPENAIVTFYPDDPWGLNAKPDLPMNELGTIKATLQSTNPERKSIWTGLYYDETAEQWTITYEVPVDYNGRHLINPSMDVLLKSIMNRLDANPPEGAYNFIVSDDGFLIAHPGALNNELKLKGQLSLDKINNQDIIRMYKLIHDNNTTSQSEVTIIDDTIGKSYLLTSFLPGPDWWLTMVYPKELIEEEAHHTSYIVLALGFSLFVLYYIAVYYVISKHVHNPLQRLQNAVSHVAHGEYKEVNQNPVLLPLEEKNEIGQLANAFLNMSREIYEVNSNLQTIVENRTKELENANSKLRDLSLLDGLTGIHNRRSFDRDLAKVFTQARHGAESFSLLLADVDSFKAYNDIYGHTAGDDVLRTISEVIGKNIRENDRVYRYGGEELAVIFNNSSIESVRTTGARIIAAIERLDIPHTGSNHGVVTLSAGIVDYTSSFENSTAMVRAADDCLYIAKSQGKNCLRTREDQNDEKTPPSPTTEDR
ncbi:sensor domain-containing diguanylate cyclase [Desulfovibrio inopinatus]|uniref:sensor domain-containing diguanylate cyclase n=1 Tax=Desulfovibrio inopinatus TaxID=102109 RepID=UPI0003F54056|nr:diguanylate cyclase [Desulfovibrio inopinatus]